MKKIILGLLLSSSAFAASQSSIFPQVYNYGYSVQVTIWNHTDKSVNCSGSVNMYLANGGSQSDFITTTVYPRNTFSRMLYPRMGGDRFTSVFNSIYCY